MSQELDKIFLIQFLGNNSIPSFCSNHFLNSTLSCVHCYVWIHRAWHQHLVSNCQHHMMGCINLKYKPIGSDSYLNLTINNIVLKESLELSIFYFLHVCICPAIKKLYSSLIKSPQINRWNLLELTNMISGKHRRIQCLSENMLLLF